MKLNPHYAEAINNLGTIFYARKSYRRAIAQYKKALRLTPDIGLHSSAIWERRISRGRIIIWHSRHCISRLSHWIRKCSSIAAPGRPAAGTQRRGARQIPLLSGQDLRQGRRCRHALMYIRKSLEEGFKEPRQIQAGS